MAFFDRIQLSIDSKLKSLCSNLRLSCIEAEVIVQPSSDRLISEIDQQIRKLSESVKLQEISKIPIIHASRQAYKACGKDPARYRLSAEALLRRIVSGKGLYSINNVVDQLNLVSVSTGFSIGGYDADQIQGRIIFGIGQKGEPYTGIGRGELNIENLPVFRDDLGAFGTPTSDSERTGVSDKTKHFLMILIDFGSYNHLDSATQMAVHLLEEFCHALNVNVCRIE